MQKNVARFLFFYIIRRLSSYCLGGEIGRRKGLKIPRSKGRAGSTPAQGTKNQRALLKRVRLFFCA